MSDASRCTVAKHDADANRSESGPKVSMNKELQPKNMSMMCAYIFCNVDVKGVMSLTWV